MEVTWSSLGKERLEKMAEAGAQILECYRLLNKGGSNVVAEVLKGQGTFYEMDHYPEGDAYDPETHSQFYYHSHREGEHGHFHTFLREAGMPAGMRPARQTRAPFMDDRDDTLSHLIAISMDKSGFPTQLFTTNRWVTADHWYKSEDVITMLDRFDMDMSFPSLVTNIWLTNVVRLLRPQIEELIRARDVKVEAWAAEHPDEDAFEDRDLEITSLLDISVEAQIEAVSKALAN